jgi:leucyl-tRNA synthetase
VERISETTKEGVRLASPPSTRPRERIPVWIADYVLLEYGTGAIMAVPAHDQRDFEFAKLQNLPIRVVIQPPGEALDERTMTQAYVGPGVQANSGQFDGLPNEEGKIKIAERLEARGVGRRVTNYRLHDWLVPRYWGTPSVIYCDAAASCRSGR